MKCKNCCGEGFNKDCSEIAKHCNDCKVYGRCKCPKRTYYKVKEIRALTY